MTDFPSGFATQFATQLATLNDVTALNTLVNSAYRGESSRRGWTTEADVLGGQRIDEDRLREMIADPNQKILCARNRNSEIIACVALERFTDSFGVACYLGMLTVAPELQSSGIGKQLVRAAEDTARTMGAQRMTLGVINTRHELMAWYERRGYMRTMAKEPFPYDDPRFGIPMRNDLYFEIFEKLL